MFLYTFEIIPIGLGRPPVRSDIVVMQVIDENETNAELRLFDYVQLDKYFIHGTMEEDLKPGLLPRPLVETSLQVILDGI